MAQSLFVRAHQPSASDAQPGAAHRHGERRRHIVVVALVIALASASCGHGQEGVRNARQMAGVGAGLAAVGGAAWAIGDRNGSNGLMVPGMVAVAIGIAAIIAAGGIIAGSVACEADADCPTGQGCRETPAAAGRLPYSQCVSR